MIQSKSKKRIRRQRKPSAQTIYESSSKHPIHIPNELVSLFSRDSLKPFLHLLSSSCQLRRQTPIPLEKVSRFGKFTCWIYTRQSMATSSSSSIAMSLLRIHPSFNPSLPRRNSCKNFSGSDDANKKHSEGCWRNVLLGQRRPN